MYANLVCKKSSTLILFRYLILLTGATAFGQGHMASILLMECSAVRYNYICVNLMSF